MQDADRPADVQTLSLPTGRRCTCIDLDAPRIVLRAYRVGRIRRHCCRRQHVGQRSPVGPSEAELTIGLAFHLITLFVNGPVMPPTEHREIRECRRSAMRPMPEALVAVVKRTSQRRRNRSCARADLDNAPIRIVTHYHAAGIAREALRRPRGSARAAFEHRLARCIGVGEHLRIDVNDDLIPFARDAGIHSAMEGGLGDERQRVRLLLLHGRRVRRAVDDRQRTRAGRSRGNVLRLPVGCTPKVRH
jgi:hypothetical protein